MNRLAACLAASIALAAAGTAFAAPPSLNVALKNGAGADLGHVMLTAAPNGVLLRVQAKGLPPGWHGLHFHEKADCSKADFTSAGGHVHGKATMTHGLLNPDANEAGDLPNLYVAADGTGTAEIFYSYVSIGGSEGRENLADADGSAIVIHANADDHTTQPIGGAGARIACGVVPAG
jgi:Cu-Zn family superoxide dismutase